MPFAWGFSMSFWKSSAAMVMVQSARPVPGLQEGPLSARVDVPLAAPSPVMLIWYFAPIVFASSAFFASCGGELLVEELLDVDGHGASGARKGAPTAARPRCSRAADGVKEYRPRYPRQRGGSKPLRPAGQALGSQGCDGTRRPVERERHGEHEERGRWRRAARWAGGAPGRPA